jgi:transcriptional regulator with XRE-family HTH domain
MNTASESFGRRLKSERERRGIPLETIAASTKIKCSLLADLERDDVSKWPQGTVFRRAFVREYAASIGLPPESIVEEFVRVFPDQQPAPGERRASPEPPRDLRLTLADGGRAPLKTIALRVATAMLEACAILAVARILTWSTGLSFWTVCGAASLAYYALASACWGRTPASWWLQGDQRVASSDQRVRAKSRDLLALLVQQAQIRRPDGDRSAISIHATGAENLQAASGIILRS